uniref:Transmembrane protein n=1 Tax=Plectus sambesii TaxID=2011161 RepID=A0A914X5D9_9BILA
MFLHFYIMSRSKKNQIKEAPVQYYQINFGTVRDALREVGRHRFIWCFAVVVVAVCFQLAVACRPDSSECWTCILSALASVGCSVLALTVLDDRKTTAVAVTSVASLLTLTSVLVALALVAECAWNRALLVLIAFHSIVAPFVLLIRQ